jgi:hypothetical protein
MVVVADASEPEKSVKVRVLGSFRVVHDGEPYTDGAEITVPESTAVEWERSRWVERVSKS